MTSPAPPPRPPTHCPGCGSRLTSTEGRMITRGDGPRPAYLLVTQGRCGVCPAAFRMELNYPDGLSLSTYHLALSG